MAPWILAVHELSIMEGALSLALEQAREAGAERVLVIRLRIGALSGVVPEALEFAFEALTPGTLAEGAQLAVENVPALFWCPDCRRGFQADDLFAECPECRRPSGDLRAGRELELVSLEIDRGPGTTEVGQGDRGRAKTPAACAAQTANDSNGD